MTMAVAKCTAKAVAREPWLRSAFEEFVTVLAPTADGADTEVYAEVMWSALHGLATLTRRGRLPEHRQRDRLDLLLGRLTGTRPEAAG